MGNHQIKVMEEIVQGVIDAIEAGTAPWQRPWDTRGVACDPTNLATGREYKGLNRLWLWLRGDAIGCSYWVGFHQARKLGGKPKKGGGVWILAPLTRKFEDPETGETRPIISGFKPVCVFNALAGVEGLEGKLPQPDDTEPRKLDAPALDQFIQNTHAVIHFAGNRACYNKILDQIEVPPRDQFHTPGGFYGTVLHELTHWTAHKSRLDRDPDKGKRGYAFEELVAELGAYFSSGRLNCPNEEENHASYLKSWLSSLRDDPKYLWQAASQAEKASDYLLQFQATEKEAQV